MSLRLLVLLAAIYALAVIAAEAEASHPTCTPVVSQGWQEQVCVVPAEQLGFAPLPIECKVLGNNGNLAAIRCFTGEYIAPRWVQGKKPVCGWLCKPKKRQRANKPQVIDILIRTL